MSLADTYGLPPLQPTDNVREATMALTPRQRDRIHWTSPDPDRWKVRSRTYPGIAGAMADQWGRVLLDQHLVTAEVNR